MKRYLTFGMQYFRETQIENNAYSHKNLLAVDYAGKDEGRDKWYAWDGCYKVISVKPYKTTGYSNTVFFTPCNEVGQPQKVVCADNVERYVTLAMTHDNVIDWSAGDIVPKGSKIYDEGTVGNASGNHIHIEISGGIHYNKTWVNGAFVMANALMPSRVLFIRKDKTTYISGRKYTELKIPEIPSGYLVREYPYTKIEEVKKLQRCLNFTLGTNLVINGHFGQKTEAAVMKFQKECGNLTVNGRVGDKTKSKLREIIL